MKMPNIRRHVPYLALLGALCLALSPFALAAINPSTGIGLVVLADSNTPTQQGAIDSSGALATRSATETAYHLSGGTTASNNATLIAAAPAGGSRTLTRLFPINTSATLAYLKLYDSAVSPTCSSATNLKHVIPIPASATGAGFSIQLSEAYTNGLAFCVTGAGTDTDNSNSPTGVYIEASYR